MPHKFQGPIRKLFSLTRNLEYDFQPNGSAERKACDATSLQRPQSGITRGLVQEPEQWLWSSYRSYAFGEVGAVRINEWGKAKIKIPTQAA